MAASALHIIIIGGGIGGLCLAQGLKAAGVSVAVYERNAADSWPEGYRIHINPLGSNALRACLPPALWDVFASTAAKPPAGLGFLTEQLEELVVIGQDFMGRQAGIAGDAHYPINRITLRHLLLAGMQEVVYFNKTFATYTQGADGKVTARFTDGSTATGDVLVAADGANSLVRKQYLPQAQRVEIDAAAIAGKVPLTAQTRAWLPGQLTSRMNLIMPPGQCALFIAPFDRQPMSAALRSKLDQQANMLNLDVERLIDHSQQYLLWAYMAPHNAFPADVEELNPSAKQRFVGERIADWSPTLRRLINEADLSSVKYNPFKTMLPVEPWPSSNITVLGDAIHNMPPVGGLGGNTALHDASVLAQRLIAVQRGELPLLRAIRLYEDEMRATGFAAVRSVLGNTRQATTGNPLNRAVARTWFRLCRTFPTLKNVLENRWTTPMRSRPLSV